VIVKRTVNNTLQIVFLAGADFNSEWKWVRIHFHSTWYLCFGN